MNICATDHLASYTASSIFPVKLLHNEGILDDEGRIVPFHIQLCPTNECNLNCEYCSCAGRQHELSLPWLDVREMLIMFAVMGSRAITITGGGEPLLYPKINELVDIADRLGMKVGLVTNGVAIQRLETPAVAWLRVSFSDDRLPDKTFLDNLDAAVKRMPKTDWAFSYILTRRPKYDRIKTIVKFAEEHNFSHIRLVSDLMDLDNVPDMSKAKSALHDAPGETRVIYQGRKEYTTGQKHCLISLLKPTIGADGGIYPCCGVQYALVNPSRDFEKTMRMGHWTEFRDIMREQRHFDGSVCAKCYYKEYNDVLQMKVMRVKHKEHI